MQSKEIMAAHGVQDVPMKGKKESSSEFNVTPEVGLVMDDSAAVWGDTQADLADMQRLGKKQEFQACPSIASTSISITY